ncbi:MAG: preprotein translocase subunit SecA [Candidatus Vogelbacteria bacterium CG10_big_fil_rev_8_21_14_0_10_49_38]|uniref:Protein translocase subunit SecA n=1 Tax=Candidatus Vogelbacteria bacterium CG10_big_fil_rev_8_21_14_0_10_49_38 TaxID=1975043 RepID=A0A2H0RI21_9BACT|nr:MAG: preprotein translocase subunit SecA [bacterium CG10_49_38]PIR46097.1 MAG: preprotein translocase subunit SecA [Candidatus Vogelbacteria bacterium CG10_big_fil_rev_8_21_14_0_10_49_38]
MFDWKNWFKRAVDDKFVRSVAPVVKEINDLEESLTALSDADLAARTGDFKTRLAAGASLDSLLAEAFATVRETARRRLGQRHFDVQLVGGIALHRGRIAEMRTGEGKTLVATLPVYLNALSGQGVHVVTVNDYLARRDAVWMGQIYDFLGLSIGVLNSQTSYRYDPSHQDLDQARDAEGSFRVVHEFLRPCSRAEAYSADIVYGANNEYGFDYLRDNMAYAPAERVQRLEASARHHFAIIDEVDSILIDEARTPLIISAPSGESEKLYATFTRIAGQLTKDEDYTVDEKMKAISLTDDGITKAEQALGVDNIYTDKGIKYVHHLETAVRAKALFERDRHYVVRDDEVVIVDEFTGRLQPGRRWSEGLHQAIESKEGVTVKAESRTFATITLQNYFRLYQKLAGMTGTAQTSAEEFLKVYGLDVVAVPANRGSRRLDLPDQIFQTEKGKFQAVARTVAELHRRGQPVLVGTASIEKNELLSAYFKKEGIPHKLLNAKNHEEEGLVIASAGAKGAVVIATNMAGRGVDIKLGGPTPTEAEAEAVKSLGGLFVLGTERHEARRIDNQLRGRAGRQGDLGSTQFYVSLEDDLMRVFGSDRIKRMMGRFGIPEDEPIENRLVSKALESAQSKIEGLNFDMRKHLLEYDDVVSHQRQTIYERRNAILLGQTQAVEEFITQAFLALSLTEAGKKELEQKIEARREALGGDNFIVNARRLILQVIDLHWVEHLEAIDYLRGSVRLRAYGQRDPLVEFKKEGLRLFKETEAAIFEDVLGYLANLGAEVKAEQVSLEAVHDSAASITGADHPVAKPQVLNQAGQKVGRNDPCPCGSGKKYKKCHGA